METPLYYVDVGQQKTLQASQTVVDSKEVEWQGQQVIDAIASVSEAVDEPESPW